MIQSNNTSSMRQVNRHSNSSVEPLEKKAYPKQHSAKKEDKKKQSGLMDNNEENVTMMELHK